MTPYIIRCLTALEDMEYKGRMMAFLDISPIDIDEHPKTFNPATQCLDPRIGLSAQQLRIGVVQVGDGTMISTMTMMRTTVQGGC